MEEDLTKNQLEEIVNIIHQAKQSVFLKQLHCCGVIYRMPDHEEAFWNHKRTCPHTKKIKKHKLL